MSLRRSHGSKDSTAPQRIAPLCSPAFAAIRVRPCQGAGEQRLVAVAEVLDVLHVEFMGLDVEGCSRHGKPPVSQGRPSVIIAHGTDDGNHTRLSVWIRSGGCAGQGLPLW